MSTEIDIKKPHFVSEARNFRHCDRVNNVTCQVLYPLGNDNTNVVNIYEISNNKFSIGTCSTGYQSVCSPSLTDLFLKQKAKLSVCLDAERGHHDPNILTLIKGSAFKTFVDSLPKVKNSFNVQIFLGLARSFSDYQPFPTKTQKLA